MNRKESRKLNSKVNKLSQTELDAVVTQYLYNLCSMRLWQRVKFAAKVIFTPMKN